MSSADGPDTGALGAPGLEPGGGVAPGDTPPDTGQTSGLSHPQPMPSRIGPILALTAVAILTLAMICFFSARLVTLI
ncbi:DUF6480 family protein [Antrihabitans sp. YC2-6]|uniref:DUF6480 family protein n=1 Tax=Antrihabitans sp. YC2-6 TaxID=2799498 RepID=UPI0018F5DFF8|nr:DUF6480 family protein [Antrihabitans sp. YC2-6]MBJ8347062.1 hypothetical protein [Antrihabitans sp. YC2-6]